MTAHRPTSNHDLNAMMAAAMTRLMDDAAIRPASIELLREAFAADDGREMARTTLFALLPRRIDGESWCAWLEGQPTPPRPVKRISPDWGRQPKASGAQKSALARRDEAAREVARKQAQLDEAKAVLAGREAELEEADDRMRALFLYRLLQQIAGEGEGIFTLGPLYTINRAISPYLQRDPEWETGLPEADIGKLDERRKMRREESIEILDGLDRLVGDEALELNLHRAILVAVRGRLAQVQDEAKALREAKQPAPKRIKLRAVRRSLEDQKDSVHEAAPLADRSDVFDALAAIDMGQDGESGSDAAA